MSLTTLHPNGADPRKLTVLHQTESRGAKSSSAFQSGLLLGCNEVIDLPQSFAGYPSRRETTSAALVILPDMSESLDRVIGVADSALRTLFGDVRAARPMPAPPDSAPSSGADFDLDAPPEARALSGALMRVNHVGEVCAQALYHAQSLTTRDEALRARLKQAARDEADHLAWTQARLTALGDRPSLLNPVWYAGAFAIGVLAGRAGDRASLGFVVETERQVEHHLAGHLDRLPADDLRSRAVVQAMKDDEVRHADEALAAGGVPMPAPVQAVMRLAAKVMTVTAHRL